MQNNEEIPCQNCNSTDSVVYIKLGMTEYREHIKSTQRTEMTIILCEKCFTDYKDMVFLKDMVNTYH